MNCGDLLRDPIWMHTLVDRFPQSFSKNALEDVLIIYSVALSAWFHNASAHSICYLFNGWVICILSALASAITSSVAYLEQVLEGFTVRFYWAHFWRLWKLDLCEMRAFSAQLEGRFIKCNKQRAAGLCSSSASHANWHAEKKLWIEIRLNE